MCENFKKHFLFKKEQNHWLDNLLKKSIIEFAKLFLFKFWIKKSDRVFLLSSNRTEWVEFDLAIMSIEQ